MPTRSKEFIVLCIHDSVGLDENTFFLLKGILDSSQADFWEFINPGSVLAYFLVSHNGKAKAVKLESEISKYLLSLGNNSNIGLGKSQGQLIVELRWFGRINSAPLRVTPTFVPKVQSSTFLFLQLSNFI